MTPAAGIVSAIAVTTRGTHAESLVLATGAGSLLLSHEAYSGSRMIEEFFNRTIGPTLSTTLLRSSLALLDRPLNRTHPT